MNDESQWPSRLLPSWIARSLEENSSAKYSRPDVLRVLIYPIATLAGMQPILAWSRAPVWIVGPTFGLLCGLIILYAVSFIYCLLHRPEYLRSEKYALTKYAIDQTLRGDSSTGLKEVARVPIKFLDPELGVGNVEGGDVQI